MLDDIVSWLDDYDLIVVFDKDTIEIYSGTVYGLKRDNIPLNAYVKEVSKFEDVTYVVLEDIV